MLKSRSNARLRCASTALPVCSAITTPRTSSPTHTGCAALTIIALPSDVGLRSVVRMPASAPSTSRPRGAPCVAASSSKSS
jgi:hypothetical protein